jgi:hypothetical protein
MESALLIFAQLATHVMGTLSQYMGTLHSMLLGALGHGSVVVRLAAMKATCAFILVRGTAQHGTACLAGCLPTGRAASARPCPSFAPKHQPPP